LAGSSLKAQFEAAIEIVTDALDSGKASSKLDQWVEATQS
jgi:anthranilate phosphoribosyltransferase